MDFGRAQKLGQIVQFHSFENNIFCLPAQISVGFVAILSELAIVLIDFFQFLRFHSFLGFVVRVDEVRSV
jgi:hypothetical protein